MLEEGAKIGTESLGSRSCVDFIDADPWVSGATGSDRQNPSGVQVVIDESGTTASISDFSHENYDSIEKIGKLFHVTEVPDPICPVNEDLWDKLIGSLHSRGFVYCRDLLAITTRRT